MGAYLFYSMDLFPAAQILVNSIISELRMRNFLIVSEIIRRLSRDFSKGPVHGII